MRIVFVMNLNFIGKVSELNLHIPLIVDWIDWTFQEFPIYDFSPSIFESKFPDQ